MELEPLTATQRCVSRRLRVRNPNAIFPEPRHLGTLIDVGGCYKVGSCLEAFTTVDDVNPARPYTYYTALGVLVYKVKQDLYHQEYDQDLLLRPHIMP